MLRNTFSKTLFDKRWTVFWWFIAAFVTTFLIMQLFPLVRDLMTELSADEASSSFMEQFAGDSAVWQTVDGYMGAEIFGQMSILVVIFAIIFGVSTLASEEKSGVLLTQLARPIHRPSLLLQKYLALLIATLLVTVGFASGALVGTIALGETIPLAQLIHPTIAMFLLSASFGSIGLALGAIGLNGGGIITGFYAVVGYFLGLARGTVDIIDHIAKISPFYFYQSPLIMADGLTTTVAIGLLAFTLAPIIIAIPIFARRDLKTR